MIRITRNPIHPEAAIETVRKKAYGAVIAYVGTVREVSHDRRVLFMEHQATLQDLARQELERIVGEIRLKWHLEDISIIHRIGKLRTGEILLVVAVGAGFVHVLDVTDPSDPVEIGGLSGLIGLRSGVAIDGRRAFVSVVVGSLFVVDLSDPTHPRLAGARTWQPWTGVDGSPVVAAKVAELKAAALEELARIEALGGAIAALMSSLASLFNSSATLFTVDFYQRMRPDRTQQHYLRVGRMATATVVLLGCAWVPVIPLLGESLYEALQKVQSLIAPSIVAVFFLGIFSNRVTPAAGFWGLVLGFAAGMFYLLLDLFPALAQSNGFFAAVQGMNWLYYCCALLIFSVGVMVVVSLFTKARTHEELAGLTYSAVSDEQSREVRESWSAWDVVNTAVVLGIIVTCYVTFF